MNNVNILFEIKTGEVISKEEKVRPPMDLAIVLDRSGSMTGVKLENSKATIKKIIDNLNTLDRLHFITYDTQIQVVFEDGNLADSENLKRQVDRVGPGGCTNMGDALQKASELLLKNKKASFQRIYVFSDGLVNSGKYRSQTEIFGLVKRIHDQDISTTSFGIGSSFDEDMMKGIAEYGHSNYFFIESAEEIDHYVSGALGAMLGRVGTNGIFKIRGKDQSIVKQIYGQPTSCLVNGMVIGDIKQKNSKNILVEVDVSPNSSHDEQAIASYSFEWNRKEDGEKVKVEGVVTLKKTDDESLIQKKNEEAEVALVMQKTAEMDDEILSLLEENRIDEALENEIHQVSLYQSVAKADKTGRVSSTLAKAEKSIAEIKAKGNAAENIKRKKYHQMLKRADSTDFLAM
jgi:Ca-activated chloride channel family protein